MECRSCGEGDNLTEVLDLGDIHLADFRDDHQTSPKYPLVLMLCNECGLCQLRDSVPQDVLYTNNYGYYSGVNTTIKHDLAEIVKNSIKFAEPSPGSFVLDIAANDGTLLSNYQDQFLRVGVDPVKKFKELSIEHADYIVDDFFTKEAVLPLLDGERFKIITSISCFYDIPDPNQFVEDVKSVLHPGGIWIVQQNYLGTMLKYNAYCNIVHEHLEYYSLLAMEYLMERHGLSIFRVEQNGINGGSFRTYICHKGQRNIDPSVMIMRKREKLQGLNTPVPYREFAKRVDQLSYELYDLIEDSVFSGNRVALLGASTRSNTFLQYSKLDNRLICYGVDRNPAKWGKQFSSINIPIVSEEHFRRDEPEFALVGPWFFPEVWAREHEYHKRNSFIIPLPKVRIIPPTGEE